MTVVILPNTSGGLADKLADAELHFTSGALAGVKVIGFQIWQRRLGRVVLLPSVMYRSRGEDRRAPLLHACEPEGDGALVDLRARILAAYAEAEAAAPRACPECGTRLTTESPAAGALPANYCTSCDRECAEARPPALREAIARRRPRSATR